MTQHEWIYGLGGNIQLSELREAHRTYERFHPPVSVFVVPIENPVQKYVARHLPGFVPAGQLVNQDINDVIAQVRGFGSCEQFVFTTHKEGV